MVEFTYQILDDDTIAIMKYKGDEEEVTIPDTAWGRPVTVLYDDLFKGHSELTKVNLPDSITNIGGFVFDGCDKLKTVILPNGLQEMWQYAFVRSGIELIEVPGTVKRIVANVFAECDKLQLAVLHEGTEKIYGNAFRDCKNLQMVAVHSATEVMHNAFEGCDKINPDLRIKMKGTCKCPQCSGGAKKIDVMSMLKR